jgi:hypothetical protein
LVGVGEETIQGIVGVAGSIVGGIDDRENIPDFIVSIRGYTAEGIY